MASVIELIIEHAWVPPWDPIGDRLEPGCRKNPNNIPWGFPIYRTYYGKESDKVWQNLLCSLKHQMKLALGHYEGNEEVDQDDIQRLKELFDLDVYDNPSVLNGLDIRSFREFCKKQEHRVDKVLNPRLRLRYKLPRAREDLAMTDNIYDIVLLADEKVLKDIAKGEFLVKAVSLLWTDGDDSWGWMRVPTGYLLDLWYHLYFFSDYTYRALSFRGTEEDLDDYVWSGDVALMAQASARKFGHGIATILAKTSEKCILAKASQKHVKKGKVQIERVHLYSMNRGQMQSKRV